MQSYFTIEIWMVVWLVLCPARNQYSITVEANFILPSLTLAHKTNSVFNPAEVGKCVSYNSWTDLRFFDDTFVPNEFTTSAR